MTDKKTRLVSERRALNLYSPKNLSLAIHQQLDFRGNALRKAMYRHILDIKASLSSAHNRLTALGPLSVLNRGYSITRKIKGHEVIRDAGEVKEGGRVQVILSRGELECRVEISKPDREF